MCGVVEKVDNSELFSIAFVLQSINVNVTNFIKKISQKLQPLDRTQKYMNR